MQTASSMPASAASRIASAAPGGGTRITEAFAPVATALRARERRPLRRELVKLFDEAALGLEPARALRLLAEWHVLGALEPGLALERPAIAPLRPLGRAVAARPRPGPR